MNRAQRRAKAKADSKELKYKYERNIFDIDWFDGIKINDGDKFTIPGVKKISGGWMRNCRPGEETVLTARIINKPQVKFIKV